MFQVFAALPELCYAPRGSEEILLSSLWPKEAARNGAEASAPDELVPPVRSRPWILDGSWGCEDASRSAYGIK